MNELAEVGKTLSVFIAGVLYLAIWVWALECEKDCNSNALWETILSKGFICIHLLLLIVFFAWSWGR